MLRVMAETSSGTFLMTIWDDQTEMVLSWLPLSSLLAAHFSKCRDQTNLLTAHFSKCRDGANLIVEDKEVPPDSLHPP
jgi:hypothetical protein